MNLFNRAADIGTEIIHHPFIYVTDALFVGTGIYESVHGNVGAALLAFGFAAATTGVYYRWSKRR